MFQVMDWQIAPVAKVDRIKETLGSDYSRLNRLNARGWNLDAETVYSNDDSDTYVYEVDGILAPERDMSKIQVWVKLKANSKMLNPQELAVKVGYISTDSDYGEQINTLTLVRLKYTVKKQNSNKEIGIEVLGAPRGLSTDDIKGRTLDLGELNF